MARVSYLTSYPDLDVPENPEPHMRPRRASKPSPATIIARFSDIAARVSNRTRP
jgi:hypothetical protein